MEGITYERIHAARRAIRGIAGAPPRVPGGAGAAIAPGRGPGTRLDAGMMMGRGGALAGRTVKGRAHEP